MPSSYILLFCILFPSTALFRSGGFLTTPVLCFYGIPPTVAAASAATQVTGASVSGVFAHLHRNSVDIRMGSVMVGGGIVGAAIGAGLFRLLQSIGQIDTAIAVLYVLMLGGIGLLMAKEAVPSSIAMKQGKHPPARKRPRPEARRVGKES